MMCKVSNMLCANSSLHQNLSSLLQRGARVIVLMITGGGKVSNFCMIVRPFLVLRNTKHTYSTLLSRNKKNLGLRKGEQRKDIAVAQVTVGGRNNKLIMIFGKRDKNNLQSIINGIATATRTKSSGSSVKGFFSAAIVLSHAPNTITRIDLLNVIHRLHERVEKGGALLYSSSSTGT